MQFEGVDRTTFAAGEFTDEALSGETLYRILDHARFAPSGGNRQGWRVIAVREAHTRRRLGDIIRPVFQLYAAQVQAGENPWNPVVPSRVRAADAARVDASYPIVDRIEELLGLPEHYAVAGMIALGRPVKQLTKLRRNPVESFATWERFDGPALTAAPTRSGREQ